MEAFVNIEPIDLPAFLSVESSYRRIVAFAVQSQCFVEKPDRR